MNEINVSMAVVPGSINLNYEETKQYILSVLEEYESAIFSDESIKTAKVIVADLRKQQKELDSRRISAKKEYMKPFELAEGMAKELIGMYDKPINFIDDQIKGYEERKRLEKREKIQSLYDELIGGLEEYLPLDKIFNPKWENVTFTMKNVQDELTALCDSTDQAIAVIRGMKSEAGDQALEKFKVDLSLANAMTFINEYESQKAAILEKEKERLAQEEEKRKQDEIERIRREEREKIAAEQKAEADKQAEIEMVREQARIDAQAELLSIKEPVKESNEDLEAAFSADDLVKVTFTVLASKEEIEQVEMYMNSIGVEYTRG